MVAHFSEVMVWSLAYAIVGAAAAGADPVYFAFVNYTTLGYGDVTPVGRWRLRYRGANRIVLATWASPPCFNRCYRAPSMKSKGRLVMPSRNILSMSKARYYCPIDQGSLLDERTP
jgi:hypothetical protein